MEKVVKTDCGSCHQGQPRLHFLKQDAHHFLQPGGGDDATKEEKMCFSASFQRFYH